MRISVRRSRLSQCPAYWRSRHAPGLCPIANFCIFKANCVAIFLQGQMRGTNSAAKIGLGTNLMDARPPTECTTRPAVRAACLGPWCQHLRHTIGFLNQSKFPAQNTMPSLVSPSSAIIGRLRNYCKVLARPVSSGTAEHRCVNISLLEPLHIAPRSSCLSALRQRTVSRLIIIANHTTSQTIACALPIPGVPSIPMGVLARVRPEPACQSRDLSFDKRHAAGDRQAKIERRGGPESLAYESETPMHARSAQSCVSALVTLCLAVRGYGWWVR